MLELAIFEREVLLTRFNVSRRLTARIGAWLSQKIALTITVLESAVVDNELEKILLSPSLLLTNDFSAADFSARFLSLSASLGLVITAQDEWQVIATAEEILAENGFAHLEKTVANNLSLTPISPNNLSPTIFTPTNSRSHTNNNETLSNAENLRVTIFTAVSSAEKISALGQLVFAPISDDEKLTIFYQALADENAPLRSAAARGLRNFGVNADLATAMANFADNHDLPLNAERLCDLVNHHRDHSDAVMMLLAGCLRDKNFIGDALKITLHTLTKIIDATQNVIATTPDFWRLLQERMLNAGLTTSFRDVFLAIEKIAPSAITAHFVQEILQTNSAEYRSWLLAMLNDKNLAPDEHEKLLSVAVAVFGELPTTHEKSAIVRNFIFNRGASGLLALSAKLANFSTAHQRAAIRFMDNELCAVTPPPEILLAIAESCLPLLTRAPLALRVDLLETQVCIRRDLPDDFRARTASALLSDWTNYAGWPLNNTFENCLVRLGAAAIPPILTALQQQKEITESAIFANALGRIGVELSNDDQHADVVAEEILREISRLTFNASAISDALYLAMGKISARPNLSPTINATMRRTLRARLEQTPNSAVLIQALGLACSGNRENDNDAQFLFDFCLRRLQQENLSDGITTATQNGEEVFYIGDEVSDYTEMIPACLTALTCLATNAHTAKKLRNKIISKLIKFAENAEHLAINWGLANAAKLTENLGIIGVSALVTEKQRLIIAVELTKRAPNITALTALAKIVAIKNQSAQLDRLSTALCERLMTMLQQEKNIDERAIYLRLLATALSRGRFVVRDETAWLKRAGDIFSAQIKQGVSGAARLFSTLNESGIFANCNGADGTAPSHIDDGLKRRTALM